MEFVNDGWSSGQTGNMVGLVYEWTKANSLPVTTNRAALMEMCNNVWPTELFNLTWVNKTAEDICLKIASLRTCRNQLHTMLELPGMGFDQEQGMVKVPSGWNMVNEPPPFVYLRTIGLPNNDKLEYIFEQKMLAQFQFEGDEVVPNFIE